MDLWSDIGRGIAAATGQDFAIGARRAVGGGCINSACVVEGCGRRYFVKLNQASRLAMFEAEAAGLAEIAGGRTIRAPVPVCAGTTGDSAWLVLEYLDLGGRGSGSELGRRLAEMHRVTAADYGWHRDNTIGSTPQVNTPMTDWPGFWAEWRLGFQLRLAARNGHRGSLQRRGEQLLAVLPAFFTDYVPAASLLHGDLWSGNYAFAAGGEPVIFDPAVYYGDREADLAMTELFGGFPEAFYAAYRESYPLDPGYRVRRTLYNLYHILNHLNLFGGSYGAQAERMVEALLGEVG
jgi:protein-ribulosamine 3-kinase